jgi:hypothetical protein
VETTKQFVIGGVTAALMAGGLIVAAPPASAGCINAGWVSHPFAQKCNDPIQDDGTWQRCVSYTVAGGVIPQNACAQMGPGQHPVAPVLATPPTHIDR